MSEVIARSVKKVVAAAATAEALSASTLLVAAYEIKADNSNTNQVYVGDSTVSSSNGYELDAGASHKYEDLAGRNSATEVDLAKVFIDVDTNGEGVSVIYYR